MRSERSPTPQPIVRAQRAIGDHLRTWRRLQRLTIEQVADRAGISPRTLLRIESGESGTLESVLRVARALGVLENVVRAIDPYTTDVGRLRSTETLPERVRPPKAES